MVRQMTERVAISPEIKDRLTKFKNGAGGTYDEAIELLLDLAAMLGDDEAAAGAMLQYAKKMNLNIDPPAIKGLGEDK